MREVELVIITLHSLLLQMEYSLDQIAKIMYFIYI